MLSPSLFIQRSKVKVIVNIVVLNCQQCNQCLKCQVSGHKNCQIVITFLKGHMVLGVLYDSVLQQWLSVTYSVSDKGTYRAVRGQLKTPSQMDVAAW